MFTNGAGKSTLLKIITGVLTQTSGEVDAQKKVFERFYRVDKGRSRDMGGTGLGLAIVKHAAAFHAADVSLTSKLGEGTSVTVTFP